MQSPGGLAGGSSTAHSPGPTGAPAGYDAARTGAAVMPLAAWTALAIDGPDATAFLHGQFTNDVAGLAIGAVQYNGYCSAKGRLLATFALARNGESEYLLVVPADVAPALEKRLRMFVLRAKVRIVSLSDSHACIGIAGPDGARAARVSGDAGLHREGDVSMLALPDPGTGQRLVMVAPAAAAQAHYRSLAASATPAGEAVWNWLGVLAGVAVVTTPVQDRFVPQMLNWEIIGGVSFHKGCYPGQEIVARMQYLGKLKERLYRAKVTGTDPVMAGMPLYGELFGDQSCGSIVNAAAGPDGSWDALAVVQIASAESDRLRLGADPDSRRVTLLPLPYMVPVAREK